MRKSFSVMFSISLVLTICIALIYPNMVLAKFSYSIPFQEDVLIVQRNGIVRLEKTFEFHVEASSNEDGSVIWVGIPTSETMITKVEYISEGSRIPMKFTVKKSDTYIIELKDYPAIKPGGTGRFYIEADIPDLVYWYNEEKDLTNISYIPAWWDSDTKALTLRVIFDGALSESQLSFSKNSPMEVKRGPESTELIWKYYDLKPNTKIPHAVIFPRGYLASSVTPLKAKSRAWVVYGGLIAAFALITGITILIIVYRKSARYETPLVYMKGSKAYTSLDPVEAAIFFNSNPNFIIKLIVMGLMEKNVVQFHEGGLRRVPTIERLEYYEAAFIDSVDNDLNIQEEAWKTNYMSILEKFKEKLTGYCGRATQEYYIKKLHEISVNEEGEPRWTLLKYQLTKGDTEKLDKKRAEEAMPYWMMPYHPLFAYSFLSPALNKESRRYFGTVFPYGVANASSGGHGGSCACACACACAGGGGCT